MTRYVYECLVRVVVSFDYDGERYSSPRKQAEAVALHGVREYEEVIRCTLIEAEEEYVEQEHYGE